MPSRNLVVRVADDLRELAEARAVQEGRNVADVVRSALRAYLTADAGGEALRRAVERAETAEAELRQIGGRTAVARAREARTEAVTAARKAQVSLAEVQADRFAAALEAATREDPATPAGVATATGFTQNWSYKLLRALAVLGYMEKAGRGEWLPVPGMDIREGIAAAKAEAQNGAARVAPSQRGIRGE